MFITVDVLNNVYFKALHFYGFFISSFVNFILYSTYTLKYILRLICHCFLNVYNTYFCFFFVGTVFMFYLFTFWTLGLIDVISDFSRIQFSLAFHTSPHTSPSVCHPDGSHLSVSSSPMLQFLF